eukprot:NODE_2742_length_648_cov_97.909850_g2269_i0.p2 GENE.NODE_2742_length_648_cov_97.909850_g2269_i0~~NODE_2742_length_648_cov_97.909850_g2269_i0.p2  ORF type:complete len:82 (+),score=21.01 NODE_2742_length_648_cov_97.909850_g2269_i0:212-457(+)
MALTPPRGEQENLQLDKMLFSLMICRHPPCIICIGVCVCCGCVWCVLFVWARVVGAICALRVMWVGVRTVCAVVWCVLGVC